MNMPSFTADASLYQARNHYRSTAAGRFLDDGRATVTPQACGLAKGIICGTFIGAGAAACAAFCFSGPVPCAGCWAFYLGGLYQFCHDCIPEWMRDLIDAVEYLALAVSASHRMRSANRGLLPRACFSDRWVSLDRGHATDEFPFLDQDITVLPAKANQRKET
jgi:hypothetical protein